jgi:hypothetical protein
MEVMVQGGMNLALVLEVPVAYVTLSFQMKLFLET